MLIRFVFIVHLIAFWQWPAQAHPSTLTTFPTTTFFASDLSQQNLLYDFKFPHNQLPYCPLLSQIGQLIMTVPPVLPANHPVQIKFRSAITEYQLGGVILLGAHFAFTNQINDYVDWLNQMQKGQKIGLWIAIDHEGGMVQRMGAALGLTNLPSAKTMAQSALLGPFEQLVQLSSQELLRIGFNWNLAPVLDVAYELSNPIIAGKERAFSARENEVSVWGNRQIKAMQKNLLLAAAKHFPGHGATITDSHLEMAVVLKTQSQLMQEDLVPFKAAIQMGVPSIMVGHISMPHVCGDDLPASVSACALGKLLRQDLQYEGLVITDSMSMKAITNRWTEVEAALKSLRAGADMALVSTNAFQPLIEQLCIQSEEPSTQKFWREKIAQSYTRIIKLKQQYQIFEPSLRTPIKGSLSSPLSLKLAQEIKLSAQNKPDIYQPK